MVLQFLIKLNTLRFDPAIPVLYISPRKKKKKKIYLYIKTCTGMLIATLFVIVKH